MAETNGEQSEPLPGICEITVEGFKSLRDRTTCQIRPLTILAGANSSGKSSLMQPLLLMKQTLQMDVEPAGALRLNGPNVRFRWPKEALFGGRRTFAAAVRVPSGFGLESTFRLRDRTAFEVASMRFGSKLKTSRWTPGLKGDALRRRIPKAVFRNLDSLSDEANSHLEPVVVAHGCFLFAEVPMLDREDPIPSAGGFVYRISPAHVFIDAIGSIIHLAGHRGLPARTYEAQASGPDYKGTFESYTASVVLDWFGPQLDPRLARLEHWLQCLGLACKVHPTLTDPTHIQLEVSRCVSPRNGSADLVNIADVGFGVSQVLPVLVALLAAEPGQLVYLEQPELHLHPRAQVALAGPLVEAAKRGVRVVAETHSDLLLLAVQTAVAKGEIDPKLVMLHWFERDPEGVSHVTSREPDETGAFADWPVDFGAVRIQAERELIAAGWE